MTLESMRTWSVLPILLIGTIACSTALIKPSPTPSSTFTYSVTVEDATTRDPIVGAMVTIRTGNLAPIDKYTGSNGFARLRIPARYMGKVGTLIVEKDGYQKWEQEIDFLPNQTDKTVRLKAERALGTLPHATPTPSPALPPTPTPQSTLPHATPTPTNMTAVANQWASIYCKPEAKDEYELDTVAPNQVVTVIGRSEYGNWLFIRNEEGTEGFADRKRFNWEGDFTSLPTPGWPACPKSTGTPSVTTISNRIIFASNRYGNFDIFTMNPDGSDVRRITSTYHNDRHPDWSPDHKQIVFAREIGTHNFDIYVMNADGSGQKCIVQHTANDMWPTWSPDGHWIAFQSNRNGDNDIYLVRPDGSDLHTIVKYPKAQDERPAWFPDGQRLAFQSNRGGCCWQIYSVNLYGYGEVHHVASGDNEQEPDRSPTEDRFVFVSDRTGNKELYYSLGNRRYQFTDIGTEERSPSWSPGGQIITFVSNKSGKYDIYAVSFDDVLQNGSRATWMQLTKDQGDNEDPRW